MERTKERSYRIYALCQSAIFIALATILSFLPVYEMPMGGSVTLASMLPILFVGMKFGPKWGLGTSFVYALIQLGQALIKGNVFIYTITVTAVIVCVLFDYLAPFAVLGFSFLAKSKKSDKLSITRALTVFGIIIFIRFLCHFITGMTIWGQWDDGFWGAFTFSLAYNGSYMLPELIITLVVTAFLLSSKQIEKLVDSLK